MAFPTTHWSQLAVASLHGEGSARDALEMIRRNVELEARPIDDLHLKGFNHPVLAMEILRWREESPQAAETSAERRRSSARNATVVNCFPSHHAHVCDSSGTEFHPIAGSSMTACMCAS